MPTKALAALLGLVLLVGCAGDVTQPGLAADHPANPDAAAASVPPPSETLTIAAASDTPAKPASEASHDHAAMQHGQGQQHGGADQQGAGASGHAHHGDTARTTTAPATTKPAGGASQYVCPHHPEVISDKPDQRCPKCKMKLVTKEAKPNAGTAHEGHEGH